MATKKEKPPTTEENPIAISSESSHSDDNSDVDVEGLYPEHFVATIKQEPSEEMKYVMRIAKEAVASGSEDLFSSSPPTQSTTKEMKYVKKIAQETGSSLGSDELFTPPPTKMTESQRREASKEGLPSSTPTMSPTASELEELCRERQERKYELYSSTPPTPEQEEQQMSESEPEELETVELEQEQNSESDYNMDDEEEEDDFFETPGQ